MMSAAHRKPPRLQPGRGLNANFFNVLRREAISIAVLVRQRPRGIVKRFHVNVGQVGGVVSAYPAAILVVTDVRKWKTKARVTGEIPAFIAVDVTLEDEE
jgi:hypothetical protein